MNETVIRGALPSGVRAFSTTRATREADLVLPSEPCWLAQVHGTAVHDADIGEAGKPEADAAVTRRCGRVLVLRTADCLPVVLAARNASEVAVAHAGWRGLSAGVLERCVAAMRTPPGDIAAWVGPAIGPESYEVGAEVRDAFIARDPGAVVAFAARRPGHWLCDLILLARRRLAALGIDDVAGGEYDTFARGDLFPSFRRDGTPERLATYVWIEP